MLEGAFGVAAGAALGKRVVDVRELGRVNLAAKVFDLVRDGVARIGHFFVLRGALLRGDSHAVWKVEDELRVLHGDGRRVVLDQRRLRRPVEVANHRLASTPCGAVQCLELAVGR